MPAFLPHKHTLSDCTALSFPASPFSTHCLLAEDSFKNCPGTISAHSKGAHEELDGPYTTGPESGDHLRLFLQSLPFGDKLNHFKSQVNISIEI